MRGPADGRVRSSFDSVCTFRTVSVVAASARKGRRRNGGAGDDRILLTCFFLALSPLFRARISLVRECAYSIFRAEAGAHLEFLSRISKPRRKNEQKVAAEAAVKRRTNFDVDDNDLFRSLSRALLSHLLLSKHPPLSLSLSLSLPPTPPSLQTAQPTKRAATSTSASTVSRRCSARA